MDSFCVLPWYSKEISTNYITPCCLLPRNVDITQLKTDLLAGDKPDACNACWKLEAEGKNSRRQFENIFLDFKLDKDIEKIREDCVSKEQEILLYQLDIGNLCNQACVSCNSHLSTKWAEIERRMNILPKPLRQFSADDSINYKTARRIEFVGGEPFYNNQTFKILENLIANSNLECFISIVTNGSVLLNSKQIALLSKFPNVNICVSIDGVGPVFEYMRWPAKWEVLISNLEQYKSIAKSISVSYTISSLNAAYYNKTTDWFQKQDLRYNHNIVTYPQWLSLDNAPEKLNFYLKSKNNFVSNLLTSNPGIDINQYVQKIKQQDTAKKIQITNYMPDLAELLGIT